MKRETSVSRRAFVGGSAVAAAGLAAGSMMGTIALADESAGVGTKYTKYPNPDEIGIVHEASAEEEFDVVVVGTGISGMSCAMLLAEQDPEAKVLLIDKETVPGGNTNLAEINAPGLSVPYQEALTAGMERAKGKMFLFSGILWAEVNSENGKVSAWLYDKHGVELATDFHYYLGHQGNRCVDTLIGIITGDPAYASIDYRLNTQAIALLMDDDHTCTGVQIKDVNSGAYTNVKAKAVMLATGGMGTNMELLSYYTGLDVAKCMPVGLGQDGDGHLMVEYTAHGKAKGCDPTSGWVTVKGYALWDPLSVAASMQYKNVFVNQYGTRFNSEDYSSSRGGQSHDFCNQGKVFSVMSKTLIDYFETYGSDHKSYYYQDLPTPVADEIEESVDGEVVFKADTYAELAEAMGLPVEPFVADMEAYEADCVAGEGDKKFGKGPEYMIALGEGPYYGFECQPVVLQTNNGIRINALAQVCDMYFTPISGLYAGGIAVSGWHSQQRELGMSQKLGLWTGLRAARTIIEENLGAAVAEDWYGPAEYQGGVAGKVHEPGKSLPGEIS
ncbi:MAG: FAD-dependent oxidoreductase [Coriobacteriales bacterium]|nr:FAD-dependent oxidoreductase [Coriobacteriales bacterium]